MSPGVDPVGLGRIQLVASVPVVSFRTTHGYYWHQHQTRFHKKTQQISIPSSNDLWLDTTGVANGNALESVGYTVQGTWLGVFLEVTDF
ncbi:hypothetical protein TNCV_2737171 [Trichonephila clavipes]|nr:hypothetical protein TNCV_2737171 [Trichonephila clavipes]